MLNYDKYQGFGGDSIKPSAGPSPDFAQISTTPSPMTKERKESNNFIKEKGKEICGADFTNRSNAGDLVGIGNILARQGKGRGQKSKYNFASFLPIWDELEKYVDEQKITINLDSFYNYYERNGWCEKNGKHLDSWHFALWYTHKTGKYL